MSQSLSWWRASSAGNKNAPFSPLVEALVSSQVERGTAMIRGFLPWSKNFARAVGPVLKATGPGITLRLKAQGSPSGIHLGTPWGPVWHRGILADKTSPIEVPHSGLILFKSRGSGPNFDPLSVICLHKHFSWSKYFIGFKRTWLALL